ncbi:MAG: porphobilinogen synthase, partial [Candidatus Margulisiibacteriota bacterium]
KYASSFYAPFRVAAESPPKFGDRKSYQMEIANTLEALREVELDIKEGADIVMIKPALPYLDIISKVRDRFNTPIAAYNVSGEYSMLKAAVKAGYLDNDKAVIEVLTSIKRAGANMIISYHAREAARMLNG